MPQTYDAFVSYNSRDRDAALRIVEFLRAHELDVWFDEDEIPPGERFLKQMGIGLRSSSSVVALISHNGVSDYQKAELELAIDFDTKSGTKLIIAFLPGAPDKLEDEQLDFAVRRLTYVRFNNNLEDPKSLDRLLWGVTGEKPASKKTPAIASIPVESAPISGDSVEKAAAKLVTAHQRFRCLTFFIGTRHGDTDKIPRQCDIARDLLKDLGIAAEEQGVLPPVDNVGTYYATRSGALELEERVTTMIYEGTRTSPALHDLLAQVIKGLRRARGNSRSPEPQLIVTTALDVMLERALLRAGIPFTRIVQHASSTDITINQYAKVISAGGKIFVAAPDEEIKEPVDDGDWQSLDGVIRDCGEMRITTDSRTGIEARAKSLQTIVLSQYPEPYVYKYHGSRDVPGSCALSTEHYMRLATLLPVPEKIIEIIGNSAAAFLSCGLLDGDAMHVYNTLLRRSYQVDNEFPRIAAVKRPASTSNDAYLRLEATAWPKVKDAVLQYRRISMVEADGEDLLREMLAKLPPEKAAGTPQ